MSEKELGSYGGALKAAGCEVHACEYFGSYQGDWMADVTLPDGRRGIISGSYGSCSGCDAFEAEIGSDYHGWETGDSHDAATKPIDGCAECAAYHAKLVKFGAEYLDKFQTAEDAANKMADPDEYWPYYEGTEMSEFILARLPFDSAAAIALKARQIAERES